jgi:hypothetical protein
MVDQVDGDSERASQELPILLRWLSTCFGVALIALGWLLLYRPPFAVTVEENGQGVVAKKTISTSQASTPAVALLLSGLGLIIYGINGFRLTQFSAGGISAESSSAAKDASKYYKQPELEDTALSIPGSTADAPIPTQPPTTILNTPASGSVEVFELKDVPISVIADAVEKWPAGEREPSNLGDFEFATRKRGKGNHPWTVKFRGCKVVVVSYGGQGKTGPTVSVPAEES